MNSTAALDSDPEDSGRLRLYEAYRDDPLVRFKDSIVNAVKEKSSGRE